MLVIGIDCGLQGAIASLRDGELIELADMPAIDLLRAHKRRREYLPAELAEILRHLYLVGGADQRALVERTQAMPRQGATSGWRIGYGAGLVAGVLAAVGVPFEWVEPRAWKAGVGLPRGADKGASIELAQRLYPTAEIGRKDGRAEALLIARYASMRFLQERAA